MYYLKKNKFIGVFWGVLVFIMMLSPMGVFAFETGAMSLSQKLTARLENMAEQAETETFSDTKVPTSLRYEVQKNETMLRIAEKMRPTHITVSQMMLALQRENPNAFYGDNVSFLNEGAVLIISDTSTLDRISAADAREEIDRQSDAWMSFRQDNKHLKSVVLSDQLLTLKEQMAKSQRLVEQKEALIAEMSRRNQALMSSQLTGQRDELAAKDLENQALVERLSILEEEKKVTLAQLNRHTDRPDSLGTDLSVFFSDMKNTIIAGLSVLVLVLILFFLFFRSRKAASSVQTNRSSMSNENQALDIEGQGLVFSANNDDALVDPAAASFSKEVTDADLEDARKSDRPNQWGESTDAVDEPGYMLDDDIDAKLDLAKAYIEMGDDKSGMDLLFEVLKDGSSKQKKEAQDIMELH